jgi:hypothetical protein
MNAADDIAEFLASRRAKITPDQAGCHSMLHRRHRALGMRAKAAAAGRTAPRRGCRESAARRTTVRLEVHE